MSLLPKRKTDRTERYPVVSLRDEVNRLFDDFFSGGFFGMPIRGEWMPALDVSETAAQVIVKAEVPGIDAKDIDVSVTGNILTIKGEKKEETSKEEQNYYRMERRYGSFQRVLTLPAAIDASKVAAGYKNGILTITLDKKEESKGRTIQVKVE